MNNVEEAIAFLKKKKNKAHPYDIEYYDMAIQALSQEPCDDAVRLTKEAYSDLCLRASKADDLQRALDMEKGAYNALVKNIQCDDAISREAVLEKAVYTETEEGWWGYTVDVDYIKSLPSVTQKFGKWIPVSERLPEKDDLYLINLDDGAYDLVYFCKGAFSYFNYSGVIAWMPLPKPYEPQESEDKE